MGSASIMASRPAAMASKKRLMEGSVSPCPREGRPERPSRRTTRPNSMRAIALDRWLSRRLPWLVFRVGWSWDALHHLHGGSYASHAGVHPTAGLAALQHRWRRRSIAAQVQRQRPVPSMFRGAKQWDTGARSHALSGPAVGLFGQWPHAITGDAADRLCVPSPRTCTPATTT